MSRTAATISQVPEECEYGERRRLTNACRGFRGSAAEALSHYKRPLEYLFIDRHDVALSARSKPRSMLVELAMQRLALERKG